MSYTRQFGGMPDSKTYPRFHMEAVQDELATAREGRPIFRQEERVQIITPGSLSQPVFRVTDEYRQRWPEHYAKFKQGEEQAVDGTPLEQWPVLNKAMVLELKAMDILTVEQVANLSDVALQRIKMGGHRMRELAKAYMDDAAHEALVTSLNKDNEALTVRVSALERQNAELSELLNRVSAQFAELQAKPNAVAAFVPQPIPTLTPEEPEVGSSLGALEAPRRGRKAA